MIVFVARVGFYFEKSFNEFQLNISFSFLINSEINRQESNDEQTKKDNTNKGKRRRRRTRNDISI